MTAKEKNDTIITLSDMAGGMYMSKEIYEHINYLKKGLDEENAGSISETLYKKIGSLIVSGQLPAKAVLPNENVMSELLGVGRSSLREVYMALAVTGFITRSKAGTYINNKEEITNAAPFSKIVEGSSKTDILEFRFMLEAENASYAAKRATNEDIEKISSSLDNMIKYKTDVAKFAYYDVEFHINIAKAAHNDLLYSLMIGSYDTLKKGIEQAGSNAHGKKGWFMDVVIEVHANLLNAIKDRDYALAYTIMKDHISYVNATVSYN